MLVLTPSPITATSDIISRLASMGIGCEKISLTRVLRNALPFLLATIRFATRAIRTQSVGESRLSIHELKLRH